MTANPYKSQLGELNAVEVMAETPRRLKTLVERLGPDGLERSLAPGKWPVRIILCHLADCEIAFGFRLRQALAEAHYTIQTFDQEAWAKPYSSLNPQTALETFTAVRTWTLALLHTVPPEGFSKGVTHPERGEITFRDLVETVAGHDLNHVRQIETIAGK